jgi:hypothetical protein
MHQLVRALAAGRYEEAAGCIRSDRDQPWDAARFEAALAPFLAEHGAIVFDPRARLAEHTLIKPVGPRRFEIRQTLLDPQDENLWNLAGEVDLDEEPGVDAPLVRLREIGT